MKFRRITPRLGTTVTFAAGVALAAGFVLWQANKNKAERAESEEQGQREEIKSPPHQSPNTRPAVRIRELVVPVELATTSTAQSRGLSGRPSLPEGTGMLFLFSTPARYRFWMPDMKFSIDIIWIGSDKKIKFIHRRLPPLVDKRKPIFYQPPVAIASVLEMNAGFADAHGIQPGQNVSLLFDEKSP